MSNTTYKLVASDLDGTLLGAEQTVSSENFRAIAELRRLGVEFVPTTGRAFGEIPSELVSCRDVRYIISSNGAAVTDNYTGEVILSKYIDSDSVKFIFDLVRDFETYTVAHRDGNSHYDAKLHNEENMQRCHISAYMKQLFEGTNLPLENFEQSIISVGKVEMFCIYFANDEERRLCKAKMIDTGKLSVAESNPYNLEIYAAGAGKGTALLELIELIGVEQKQTIAVGDSKNDITLIDKAGLGLAMENSCDELKAIADKTICHYQSHCAEYILNNFILRE